LRKLLAKWADQRLADWTVQGVNLLNPEFLSKGRMRSEQASWLEINIQVSIPRQGRQQSKLARGSYGL
jgi:hypothetical protein